MRVARRSPVLGVILNWNGKNDTLACLESLHTVPGRQIDLLVVDNGSTDGSVEATRRQFPAVTILETGRNLGYAGGMNAGLAASLRAGYAYTWLLNNDALVPGLAADALLAFMEDEVNIHVGACSPVVRFPDGTVQFAGGWVDRGNWTSGHFDDVTLGPRRVVELGDAAFLSGSALFLRNRALRDVGLFDPRFFMYWEDSDLSMRLTRAGWTLRVVPEATVFHKVFGSSGGETSPLVTYYGIRNRFLLARKHSAGASRRLAGFRTILEDLLLGARVSPWQPLDEATCVVLKGVADGLTGRFGRRAVIWDQDRARRWRMLLWLPFKVLPKTLRPMELWTSLRRLVARCFRFAAPVQVVPNGHLAGPQGSA